MLARAAIYRAPVHTSKITRTAAAAATANQRFYTPARPRSAMAAPTDTQAAAEANTSGVTPDSISATLKQKLDASHVEIEDMSGGCGQAFNAIIVSPQFDKKTLLARHRLVNSALKAEIAAIHAWTPKCYTPEQWEKEQEKMR